MKKGSKSTRDTDANVNLNPDADAVVAYVDAEVVAGAEVEEEDHQAALEEIAHRATLDYEEAKVNGDCDSEEENYF